MLPIVGITPDVSTDNARDRLTCTLTYIDAVRDAGGLPIVLTPDPETAPAQLALCHALVLTGGDDPRTEAFGVPTHPKATPLHPRRQAFELRLLELLGDHPRPTLGICLGMQLMALAAGGTLDQHMPDTRPDAARHWDADHPIAPPPARRESRLALVPGTVHSRHRQAVSDPGRLSVIATSDDGVIEGVADPALPFYLGVQWHPERTLHAPLGLDLFRRLIVAARQ